MTRRSRRQVSGNYAGAVTRFLAFLLDWFLIVALYAITLGVLSLVAGVVTRNEFRLDQRHGLVWMTALVVWAFLYLSVSLAVAGRTPGKAVVGLRVVRRSGSPLAIRHAVFRTLAFPLSFALLGMGFLGVLVGKERRALHDVIAGTAVVYDWGERPAELPTPLSRWLQRRNAAAPGSTEQSGDEPEAAPALARAAGPHRGE